jgi:hypothetical protein
VRYSDGSSSTCLEGSFTCPLISLVVVVDHLLLLFVLLPFFFFFLFLLSLFY